MNKYISFLAGVVLILLPFTASAHAGKTDGSGGHYDHSAGEYHYHHGYPAHSHSDGICPYDYDDQTGIDSGGSSTGTTDEDNSGHSTKNPSVHYNESNSYTETKEKSGFTIGGIITLILCGTFMIFIPGLFISFSISSWFQRKLNLPNWAETAITVFSFIVIDILFILMLVP